MPETLMQKAQRLGIKPANPSATEFSSPSTGTETLLQKAQRLGIKPANPLTQDPQATPTPLSQPNPDHNFWGTLKKDIGTRVENVEKIVDTTAHLGAPGQMKQSIPESALQIAGQASGGVLDIAGNALKSAIPGFLVKGMKQTGSEVKKYLPDFVKQGVQNATDSLTKPLEKFTAKHPRIAADVGAVGDVASALALPAAITDTATFAKKGIDTVIPEVKAAAEKANAYLETSKVARTAKAHAQLEDLVGKIVQGKADDIPRAKAALGSIEVDGVKTYKDLGRVLDDKVTAIAGKQDELLATANPETRSFQELGLKKNIAGTSITHNYVDDAFKQLDDFYTKTNNVEKKAALSSLKRKAETEGLTIGEVNDLARLHGAEIKAFNASGEAASGLSKQAAENTRTGVKQTARELFGNEAFNESDKQLTNLIRTRDLVEKMGEKVQSLTQRVVKRGLGEKIGRLVFRATDIFSGGALKGYIQSFVPRSAGLKILNALDLEQALQKNLSKIQAIIESGAPVADIEAKLQDIINQGPRVKLLPAPKDDFPKGMTSKVDSPMHLGPEADLGQRVRRTTRGGIQPRNLNAPGEIKIKGPNVFGPSLTTVELDANGNPLPKRNIYGPSRKRS